MKAEDITGKIQNSCEHVATFYCIKLAMAWKWKSQCVINENTYSFI